MHQIKKVLFLAVSAGLLSGVFGSLFAAEPEAVPTFIKACGDDIQKWCKDVVPGDGRVGHCLHQHMGELSEPCRKFAMHGGPGHEMASLTDIDRYYAAQKAKVPSKKVKARQKAVK